MARGACADWAYAARWQLRSLVRRAPAEDGRDLDQDGGDRPRTPVVLLPGVYESWRFLQPLVELLRGAGHPVHVVADLGYNRGGIPEAAERVGRSVAERSLPAVALVAHSKGGLIGKHLLAHPRAGARFERLVALNTPFAGSSRARWVPLRAVRVFVPGGALLGELAGATAVDPLITSVYSAVDPHVPGTGHLPGATNVEIDTVGHFRLLSDPRAHRAVLAALAAPIGTGTGGEATRAGG